jgi:hypothetical protein
MSLTDPRATLAEQNGFVHCLVGLFSLGRLVRGLAAHGVGAAETPREPDDFVHLLLALVSLGETVGRLAGPAAPTQPPGDPPRSSLTPGELLR